MQVAAFRIEIVGLYTSPQTDGAVESVASDDKVVVGIALREVQRLPLVVDNEPRRCIGQFCIRRGGQLVFVIDEDALECVL